MSAPIPRAAGRVDVDIARIAGQLTTPGVGLALVGQAYGGVRAGGDSMSVRLTYATK